MTAERLSKTSNSGAWDVLAFVQALAAEATAGRIEIPSFPDVAMQIRRVLSDDDCDTGTVARIASAEPALAARLLQMANSVALNPGRSKVTELRSAISRIGFSQVRTASLAYAMEQLRKAPDLASIRAPLSQLWESSVQVASLAYVAARSWSGVSSDRALLAGLMHNMGRVYILAHSAAYPGLLADREVYQAVVREWHAPIAELVLQNWDISADIVEAVANFEQLERAGGMRADLTDVLTVSSLLARYSGDPQALEAQLVNASACKRLGVNAETIRQVMQESADELDSLHATLNC